MIKITFAFCHVFLAARAPTGEPVFPVKVSDDHRFFVGQRGQPVFWLGTTQWQLFRDNTIDEARLILKRSKERGFTFVQVMVPGVGDGTKPDLAGEKPWLRDNPAAPNERYFARVDQVIAAADKLRLVICLSLYNPTWNKLITPRNARRWANWLARRYRSAPNVIWSMTPDATAEVLPMVREMAAGLRDGDHGAHLITVHPWLAAVSSSSVLRDPWIDFNSIQIWSKVEMIPSMVADDYQREPVMPVVMAAGAYEAGTEYGFEVTPLSIRRQAYHSILSGGHFVYGHNDSWRVLPTWKQALDAPGEVQMGDLRKVITDLKEWWRLVPDRSIFQSVDSSDDRLVSLAARHSGGKWCLVYLAQKTAFSVHLNKLPGAKKLAARWIDPRGGDTRPIGDSPPWGRRSSPPRRAGRTRCSCSSPRAPDRRLAPPDHPSRPAGGADSTGSPAPSSPACDGARSSISFHSTVHVRPSWAMRTSAAAGPQVPEA